MCSQVKSHLPVSDDQEALVLHEDVDGHLLDVHDLVDVLLEYTKI